ALKRTATGTARHPVLGTRSTLGFNARTSSWGKTTPGPRGARRAGMGWRQRTIPPLPSHNQLRGCITMSATVPVATYQHLTWTETMLGMPIGPPTSHPVGPSGAARDVLEGTLRQSLQRDRQNYVLFSGGRDSSALLALAVHVARREGLPEPLPVIVRHPDSPESDEREWQDLVLDHLDVPDHVVIEMRGDQGLLAEVARGAIRRRGPM